MIEKTLTVGYVQALFEIAKAQNAFKQTIQDLEKVVELLRENHELRKILFHPAIPRERKTQLVDSILAPHISHLVGNFLRLIIDKRREKVLERIMYEYKSIADLVGGIMRATIQTATPLSEPQLSRLKQALERLSEKKVETSTEINPKILGGVIVRMGNKIIDGSIASRLKNLRRRLVEVRVA